MKTKQGKDFNVVGQIGIDNGPYNIVKLDSAVIISGQIVKYIALSAGEFEDSLKSADHVEVIIPDQPKEEIAETIQGT
jgi:predicted metalloenzyme YecM